MQTYTNETRTVEDIETLMAADASLVMLNGLIRDASATVTSQCFTRRNHPTYGVTKAMLRTSRDKMNALIGAFAVLTGQATHIGVWTTTVLPARTAEGVAMANEDLAGEGI